MIENKTGTVIFLGEIEEVSERFSKRLVVIDTTEVGRDGQAYENCFPCEFSNNRISMLDGIAVGQQITLAYTLQGKEHNGRYYLQARGFSATPAVQQQAPFPPQQGYGQPQGYQQGYPQQAPQGYAQPQQQYQQQAPAPQPAPFPGYPTYSAGSRPYGTPENWNQPQQQPAPGGQELPWQH